MRKYILTSLLLLTITTTFAQSDSNPIHIFARVEKAAKEYKLDTTAPPNDKITKLIIELRNLKGGFNITEIIEFKIEEEKQKLDKSDTSLNKITTFFTTGNGKRWLDNAVIWIHRKRFTQKELKQLVKFYKTEAGRKMSSEFPIVLIESIAALEKVKDMLVK